MCDFCAELICVVHVAATEDFFGPLRLSDGFVCSAAMSREPMTLDVGRGRRVLSTWQGLYVYSIQYIVYSI